MSDIKDKIKEIERKLFFLNDQVIDAHRILDEMDAPNSIHGAFINHRLLWYKEGKRESYKTKDNVEGYLPKEWKNIQDKLKLTEQHGIRKSKLNIIP